MIIASTSDGLSVYGDKLVEKDLYANDNRFEEENVAIHFCEGSGDVFPGVETVEDGFIERIPHLCKIVMDDTVKYIGVTPVAENLLHKNNVLIRGKFGTYAEEFARKYHLRFAPLDMFLAKVGDYYHHGSDIISLVFFDDGTVKIHQDERCQGSSAGGDGGFDMYVDIPWDFFTAPDAQEFVASKCWGNCYDSVLNCQALKDFIEIARERYKSEKHQKLLVEF